jgi:signal transduction histidine kinase
MEPFDKDWNYPKDYRNATYTNLDPGTYTFRVKASNNDGVWNEEGTALKLIITPPYYRENWFYGICALGFFFSIFGYVRYRTHELKKNEQILVQKVTERTEEVNRQKEELETTLENLKATQAQLVQAEKMASLGILTAGVAHEINNPINFVSANVEPLRRDIQDVLQIMAAYEKTIEQYTLREKFGEVEALKKELNYELLIDEINHLLRGIKEGATRTSEIVKGLRSFSRLDENAMKALNVNEGIESTLLVLANQLKNKTIVKELGPVDELMGYPGKLNQVFMNVLSNACQAITGKGEIRIKTGMDNGNVVIRIADNGIGMTEEVQKRIFEPFFTTKKVGAGTGLGLSISYGIIKAHNGTIAVESAPGKGTAFTITIPVNKIPSL